MGNVRDRLASLLEPRTVAVVGASERRGPGRQVIENLEQLGFTGSILPVNPKYAELLDRRCYASLTEATEDAGPIDLAAILLGRDGIVPVLEEAGRLEIPAAWAFASGFSEAGSDGKRLQARLSEVCDRHGIAFCGPNCVGFVNALSGAAAFSAPVSPSLRPGDISVVAQSGSICLALLNSARGVGFRYVVSSGNEAVIDSADYIDWFLEDDRTRVVLAFVEQLRRPERFVDVAKRARWMGKPLVVLKVGRSEMARRATVTHTGALAGSDDAYDAVFRKLGVIRVEDLDEMLETAEAFSRIGSNLPAGPRVGMMTVSGGEISLIADLAEGLGMQFPEWSETARRSFSEVLPPYADLANPLDAWGSGRVEDTYVRCVDAAAEEDVDIVVISQDAPPGLAEAQIEQYRAIADAAAKASRRTGKPIVAISHLSGGVDDSLRTGFAAGDVPLLQGTREGLRAVRNLISYGRRCVQPLPTEGAREQKRLGGQWMEPGSGALDEVRSKNFFREYGIPCVEEKLCSTVEDAVRAAARFGYPVVLKAVSAQLTHKTDAGVVALDLADEAEVRVAYAAVRERALRQADPQSLEGVVVQRMVRDAVAEVLVGVVRDATFGPVVAFGHGGVFVELFRDRALGVPPLTVTDARELVLETKASQLLLGFRGRKAGDVNALAELMVSVGRMAEDWGDRIAALDMNPVMVLPEGRGVVVVDGLIERAET